MELVWRTVDDDQLQFIQETVAFLQSEFCPAGAEPMWSAEYMRWKLSEWNPAGAGHISIALIEDKVVGVVSLTRKRVLINGTQYIVGEVGDSYSSSTIRRTAKPELLSIFNSDPNSYVNKSIFGRLASNVRRRAEESGVDLIYGTPNANAYPGWTKRLGYFDYSESNNYIYTRPTTFLIGAKFNISKNVLGVISGFDESVRRLISFILYPVLSSQVILTSAMPASEEIDSLWHELKLKTGMSLVRDAAYWSHRYMEHPLAKYSWFAFRRDDRLIGLATARLIRMSDSRRSVLIAEWMIRKDISFGYVLAEIMRYFSNESPHTYSILAEKDSENANQAKRQLFFARSRLPVIFSEGPLSENLKKKRTKFDFFLGTCDAV